MVSPSIRNAYHVLSRFLCNAFTRLASVCVQNIIRIVFLLSMSGCFLIGVGGRKEPRRPTTFVEGFDGNWKVIEVRPGLDQTVLWQTTIDSIATQFDMESL